MSLAPRSSDPVSLACELEGLVPVERLDSNDAAAPSGGSPSASGRLLHPSASFRQQKEQAVAPYQALPVKGPVVNITEHLTPALNVIEPRKGEDSEALESRINQVIEDYKQRLTERTRLHMGYPYNLAFDYGPLEGLQRFCINNLGDPFIESNYGVHSREFEIGVLHWFARLWEIDQEDYWGYITNCGTEGNLHGILVGRENFPEGILYASCESHYSVFKAARMYRMDAERVDTLESGEIDYVKFSDLLKKNAGRPAIVNVNVGTTVKGAVDDLDKILEALQGAGYGENRFFIHCDGALFGLMIPFVKRAPMVTFRKPIGSVSVSGHKFIGAPVPCGVVITRQKHISALANNVEYLNSRDATIMGSRNGHAPIYLWYTLTRKGYHGMRKDVETCFRNAHILKRPRVAEEAFSSERLCEMLVAQDMLERVGVKAMLNELSSTVVFERPKEEAFVRKWQLACQGDIAHVVVMPNITLDKLEAFVTALIESRARHALATVQAVASSARTEEAELYSRPSGESPRIWATTPRYFENGTAHGGAGFGDENQRLKEQSPDLFEIASKKLGKLDLRESHANGVVK